MKNWRTSFAGGVSAVGLLLTGDTKLHALGLLLAAVGTFLTGYCAKDKHVCPVDHPNCPLNTLNTNET